VSEPTAAEVVLPEWLDDVTVRRGRVPGSLDGATADGVLWAAAPGRFWLEVPGVGRYLASEGVELTIDLFPGAEPADVVRFARMTPLAALCYQRGIVAWHAATAIRNGEAVILAGDSATGKSTLLAALLARGWEMLGDELAPVTVQGDGAVTVLPTGGEVRLWPDAIELLDPASRADAAACREAPIRAIWRLELHNGSETEVATDEGLDRFDAVGRLAYHGRIAHALLDRAAYLELAASVATNIPHHRLRRPRGRWTVAELADLIERDSA
jgi:hypothetical protein